MNSSFARRVGYILDTVWYAGSARETLMALLALLALTLGIAGVFPQQPPGLEGAAAERWLASSISIYPRVGQPLSRIGVFTIFRSPWLRLLMAALAFNVALRLAIQASTLAQHARARSSSSIPHALPAKSQGGAKSRFLGGAKSRALVGGRGGEEARTRFRNSGSSISEDLGPLLAYAGTLVLLAGLLLNSIAGWRASEAALAPGSSTALGRADAIRLSLEELTGSESNPTARIGLISKENGKPIGAGQVAAGQPIRWANLWIALRSAGPALQATARDSRGKPLLLQSLEPDNAGGLSQGEVTEVVHLLFQQTQAEQEFALPSADLSFRVVSYPALPEQDIDVPVFLVEVYQGDEQAPTLSDFVVDKATLALRGVTLDLLRDRYATVEVAYLPGLIPFLLGGLAILAGIILSIHHTPYADTPAESVSPGAQPGAEPADAP